MKKVLFVILLFTATQVNGQETGEEKLGNWLMYFGTNRLTEQYSLHTEAQLRLYEPFSNFNQLLLRVGVNYHINNYSLVTLGYGYIPTESYAEVGEGSRTYEHRIWQQFILTNSIGRLFFEHRYRVEQRWISSDVDNRYLNRLRYRLLVNIPLNNATMVDNTIFLSLYDEIFLNVTETPFDQNRLYGALGYKFNNTLSVQSGYLRHRVGANNYDRLQFGVFFNPDFRRASSPTN